MIEITAIRLDGGEDHKHISEVRWASGSATGVASRHAIVQWLKTSGANQAIVGGDGRHVPVLVVEPLAGAAYIRTYAEGEWRDELLELPRFLAHTVVFVLAKLREERELQFRAAPRVLRGALEKAGPPRLSRTGERKPAPRPSIGAAAAPTRVPSIRGWRPASASRCSPAVGAPVTP